MDTNDHLSTTRSALGLPSHSEPITSASVMSYELYRALVDAIYSIDDWEHCPPQMLTEQIISALGQDCLDHERGPHPQGIEFLAVSLDALRCYMREYQGHLRTLREELRAPDYDLFELSRLASHKSDINFFRYLEIGEEWVVYNFLSKHKNDIHLHQWMYALEIPSDRKEFLLGVLTKYNKQEFDHPDGMVAQWQKEFGDGHETILLDLAQLIYERDEVSPVEIRLSEGVPAIVLIYDDPYAHRGEGVGGYFPYHESSREPYIQIYDSGDGVTDALDHEIGHFAYHVLVRSVLGRWELMASTEQEIWRHIQDEMMAYAEEIVASDVSEEDLLPRHQAVPEYTRETVGNILKEIGSARISPEGISRVVFLSESLSDCVARIRQIVHPGS